jgi:hypothetical protein
MPPVRRYLDADDPDVGGSIQVDTYTVQARAAPTVRDVHAGLSKKRIPSVRFH